MKNLETSVVEPTPASGHHLFDKVLRDSKAMGITVVPVQDPPPAVIIDGLGVGVIQDNSPHKESKL
jgi:hypothetical protein